MSTHAAPTARRMAALVATVALFALLPGAVHTATDLTFTVDTTTDAVDASIGDGSCATTLGQCSLRAAIQEANFWPTSDLILLGVPSPSPGVAPVYGLTISGRDEDGSATGDLDISDPVRIVGTSTPPAKIDGNDLDRVLDVSPARAAPPSSRTSTSSTARRSTPPMPPTAAAAGSRTQRARSSSSTWPCSRTRRRTSAAES